MAAAAATEGEDAVKELFRAVMRDEVAAVEQLCASSSIDVLTVRNSAQQTPLQLANERGRKAVKAYLEQRKKAGGGGGGGAAASSPAPKVAPTASSSSLPKLAGRTADAPADDQQVQQLFKAVMRDDAVEVRTLVVSAKLDIAAARNKSGQTPLQLARERGKAAALACLEELLAAAPAQAVEVSVEAAEPAPEPLAAASAAVPDDRVLQLFRAVMRDEVSTVQELAAEGFDVLTATNKSGQTALQLASERGKEAVRGLLQKLASEDSASGAKQPEEQEAAPKEKEQKALQAAATNVADVPAAATSRFEACDFRTLPAAAWRELHDRFLVQKESHLPSKQPAAATNMADVPAAATSRFEACDFRTLPAAAWRELQNRFLPQAESQLPSKQPTAETKGSDPQFTEDSETQLSQPIPATQHTPASNTSVAKAVDAQAPQTPQAPSVAPPAFAPPSRSAPAPSAAADEESEESGEEETDSESEIFKHANPELGLKRRDEPSEDPWRLVLRWLCAVIKQKLEARLPPAQARQLKALLPSGGLDGEALLAEDLCDGQLLCALVIAVHPDVLPKANPVALGRIAQFLKACTALGVSKVALFTPPDLMPAPPSNAAAVLRCLQALATALQSSPGWSGPQLPGSKSSKGKGKGTA